MLNNKNKGEYSLKIMNDVNEKEKEMRITGNFGYQVVLIKIWGFLKKKNLLKKSVKIKLKL